MEVVVWVLVVGLVLAQVVYAVRRSPGVAADIRRRRVRAQLALVVGLLVFVGGTIHHQAQVAPLCCGDVARADRLVR